MRQFVRQGKSAGEVATIPISAEDYVRADCVRAGVDCFRRFRGPRIGVHSHPTEVVSKARFEECARRRVERLAGRTQDFVHNRRSLERAAKFTIRVATSKMGMASFESRVSR